MVINDREKLNRLEDLKTKLNNSSYKSKIEYYESFTHKKDINVADDWVDEKGTSADKSANKILMKTSIFKKFFFFSVLIFIFSVLYVLYALFLGGNTVSNQNIDISIFGNTFAAAGEQLSLQVEIKNRNTINLDLVDLVIEYPKGTKGNEFSDFERIRQTLGTISAGSTRNENVKLILFGEQGVVHKIKVSIEYRIEGSNSIFVKDKSYEVVISTTPLNLIVEGPSDISPNEDIAFKLKVSLNAEKKPENLILRVEYPFGFDFSSALPAPSYSNNVWSLSEISPGKEYEINVFGRMVDVFDGEEKTFQVFTGLNTNQEKDLVNVVLNSSNYMVLVKKPFIEARLFVNGNYQRSYAVNSKGTVAGSIQWKNNLDTKINDLEIRAVLTGNVLDKRSVKASGGFYDSLQDTIIWDRNYSKEFREVGPGAFGTATFSFAPIPLVSSLGIVENPSFDIKVSITGKQSLEGNLVKTLDNFEYKTVNVITELGFNNKVLHFTGPFENTGPMPPQAEKETTYTIVWSVSNTANDVSRGEIRATLPPRIRFVGTVSPEGEDLIYDPETRQVLWRVGNIRRGAGIDSLSKEVAFQVSITPSISQIDTSPTLINTATLTAFDDFANVDLSLSRNALNIQFRSEQEFNNEYSRVVSTKAE